MWSELMNEKRKKVLCLGTRREVGYFMGKRWIQARNQDLKTCQTSAEKNSIIKKKTKKLLFKGEFFMLNV